MKDVEYYKTLWAYASKTPDQDNEFSGSSGNNKALLSNQAHSEQSGFTTDTADVPLLCWNNLEESAVSAPLDSPMTLLVKKACAAIVEARELSEKQV